MGQLLFDGGDAARILALDHADQLLGQLLTELPEPDREIFLRRYYYLESCREIGQRLNMQEHTVTVRLSRGREKLRKQFLERRNAL